jgi:hypothetical protein
MQGKIEIFKNLECEDTRPAGKTQPKIQGTNGRFSEAKARLSPERVAMLTIVMRKRERPNNVYVFLLRQPVTST